MMPKPWRVWYFLFLYHYMKTQDCRGLSGMKQFSQEHIPLEQIDLEVSALRGEKLNF